MNNEHIKVFSESSIVVKGLEIRLEDNDIWSIIKDQINSGIMGGFGTLDRTVDLFILNIDLEKATPIINNYKEKINS